MSSVSKPKKLHVRKKKFVIWPFFKKITAKLKIQKKRRRYPKIASGYRHEFSKSIKEAFKKRITSAKLVAALQNEFEKFQNLETVKVTIVAAFPHIYGFLTIRIHFYWRLIRTLTEQIVLTCIQELTYFMVVVPMLLIWSFWIVLLPEPLQEGRDKSTPPITIKNLNTQNGW